MIHSVKSVLFASLLVGSFSWGMAQSAPKSQITGQPIGWEILKRRYQKIWDSVEGTRVEVPPLVVHLGASAGNRITAWAKSEEERNANARKWGLVCTATEDVSVNEEVYDPQFGVSKLTITRNDSNISALACRLTMGGRSAPVVIPVLSRLGDHGRFSFLAYSCNEPFSTQGRTGILARDLSLWLRMGARASGEDSGGQLPDRPQFALGVGDQIYVDPDPSAREPLAFFKGTRSNIFMIETGKQSLYGSLDVAYRYNFSLPPLAEAFSKLPSFMMWDDHEIRDGWGSQGDELSDPMRAYFPIARHAFIAHQWRTMARPRNKRTAPEIIQLGLRRGIRKSSLSDKDEKNTRGPGRAVVVLAILVVSIAALGAIATRRGVSNLAGGVAANPLPMPSPPSLPASGPVREYVYAGDSLLATTEPFREVPDDLGIWRPSTGVWYIASSGLSAPFTWGVQNDIPAPGDYDGDGKTDFAVFRPSDTPSKWYIVHSGNGTEYVIVYALDGDDPVSGDYDGDGLSDLAVYRPTNQTWYVKRSSDSGYSSVQLGQSGDVPAPGDFDGDGKTDYAVWRNSIPGFLIKKSTDGTIVSYSIGQSGDEPVVGDYDGDGRSDPAARRGGDNSWRIFFSSTGTLQTAITWGLSSDIAVPARYVDVSDNDAKTDIAVWRPSDGIWNIRRSTNGSQRTQAWGKSGDIPVPSNWRR